MSLFRTGTKYVNSPVMGLPNVYDSPFTYNEHKMLEFVFYPKYHKRVEIIKTPHEFMRSIKNKFNFVRN